MDHIIKYPPTPTASRGSASEEALLATRCKKGRRENLQLGPKLCRTKASSRRTRAGWLQNESQLQEDTSRVAVGSAETEVKSRFES
jgi:hypothetical protein